MRPVRPLAVLLVGGLGVLLLPVPSRAGDPVPNPLRGADVAAALAKAADLEAKEFPTLVKALADLASDRKDRGNDLEFAVEYAVRETDRSLRLLALDAARKIDRKGAAERLRKKLAEKDPLRIVLAAECLGHVGSADDVPALVEAAKSPSELIAVAAHSSLARVASGKDVDAIIEAGLGHANAHVTDHAAWAVQDILKKPKAAIAKFEKLAAKKDATGIRAAATVALLEDKLAAPHAWGDSLAKAREALLAAPPAATVPVKGAAADSVKNVEAALAWLREKMPAQDLLFRAAVKQVNVPGPSGETRPDTATDHLDVSLLDASQEPRKCAYLLLRAAVVLFQKRIGEPFLGHRGWEPGIFDSYDLCVVARLYDAGPGGLSRERFVGDRLDQRPWGGL